jgi:acetoin utilization deacetylase AcuC-like enzyme
MTTALLSHSDCLLHETPHGHPERVDRLRAINEVLAAPEFARALFREAPMGRDEHVLYAHPQRYLDKIRGAIPTEGRNALDPDTFVSPRSFDAAMRAVGANVEAVDMVMKGEVKNAFCYARPPGHHAETETAMGFCLFGNVVIAARHAIRAHGLSRVAIVDFDVHHGNGTQDLVWDDPQIFFASTHQMPLYPGTGSATESGAHNNVLNVPLAPGTDGIGFRHEMERRVLPAVDAFKPELVLISAGFDAHKRDPLANLELVEDDFAWATEQLCDLAETHCDGRLVSTLEGGYDLDALAASTAAHVKVLMERSA